MDWLIKKFRLWLGIEAEITSLHSRIKNLEGRLAAQSVAFSMVDKCLANERDAYQHADDLLKVQIDDLRRIVTTRPATPKPQQARTWTEARRMMGDEVLSDA